MKKILLGSLILLSASSSFAETITSEKSSASADVAFAETVEIGNTLTMAGSLVSGTYGDGTLIANGNITGLHDGIYTTIIADTDDIPDTKPSSDFGIGNFHGKNDPTHVISVKVMPTEPKEIIQSGEHGFNYVSFAANGNTQAYTVNLLGSQSVKADTYTVKTIAYTFIQ